MGSQKRTTIWWAALGVLVAVVMGIPGWLMVGFWFWSHRYPDPAKEPDIMKLFMTGWLSVVMVSASSILSAVMLLTVAVKWLRNKPLIAEITKLAEAKKSLRMLYDNAGNDLIAIRKEQDKLNTKLAASERAPKEANKLAEEYRKEALFESTQKDGLYATLQDRERQLAELASLRAIRTEQARNIKDHVVITKVVPGKLALNTDGSVCIFLELVIRNESFFDITIHHKDVKGCFVREGRAFRSPVAMIVNFYRLPIENLPPFQPATIYLEQPLIDFEVELIEKSLKAANARVSLDRVAIPISVGDGSQVKTRNLQIMPDNEYATFEDCRKTNNE